MAQGEWRETALLIAAALAILAAEWPMTIRQLFYRLVSTERLENITKNYKKVSRIMTKARNDGRCLYEWIVDRSRPSYEPNVFRNPAQYAEGVKRSYRKDYWDTQPAYCEIWTEKDAIIGSIQGVADELGVTVRVARGFSSTTKVHEMAEILADKNEDGKLITIFYLGDHDPSGRRIELDLERRVKQHGSGPFTMVWLGIHSADIQKFKLPPLKVKLTDSRSKEFLRKWKSGKCVELDALPPTELRRRIVEAVTGLLDSRKWNRAKAVEKVELASIVDTVSKWPGVVA